MDLYRTTAGVFLLTGVAFGQPKKAVFTPDIPKTWDTQALATWATPVAGLNVRPGHFSEAEYLRAPIDNYRTYPVYAPGREPAGYWEMLQKIGPKPLIEPSTLRTKEDWIKAGQGVFEQADILSLRTYDQNLIAVVRSPEFLTKLKYVSPDGTLRLMRWVPTGKGVALGHVNCGSCHTREEPDGSRHNGPPAYAEAATPVREIAGPTVVVNAPFHIAESLTERMYRAMAVPWVKDDVHERFKTMSQQEAAALHANALLPKA